MKYCQYIILTILLGINNWAIQAQSYIPMAQDSAVWFYEAQEGVFAPVERFIFFIDGDTSISNFDYKKIYFKAENQQDIKVIAAIRDDVMTKKVYTQLFTRELAFGLSIADDCPLNIEIQLYDFGATLHQFISNTCNQANTVSDTSTQFLYEKNRRILEFSNINQIWYEGIGSLYGLFNPLSDVADYRLTNYCIGSFDNCNVQLFLDTEYIPINKQGKIFPNPTTEQFTLELTNEIYDAQVIISDIYGQIVYTSTFNGNQQIIPSLLLTNGVYFVEVFDDGILTFKDKLMIAR
jgi:hypothetical protein